MKSMTGINNRIIALILFVGTSLLLFFTADSIGVTWDEPAYIPAAQSYSSWFEEVFRDPVQALSSATIDMYWSANHEHPPVAKSWTGLIWLAASQLFHASNELTAIRLGSVLMVALLVSLLYIMIARTYGKAAGLFAALALLSMPRFFFHAHLASLDVPVSVMWFLFIYVFWKTVDRESWAWGLLWGVIWGLAVATKLNGVFIPLVPLVWILIFRRKWSLILRLVVMGLTAMITFVLAWPWLYHQTWSRILEYINFHLYHFPIGQWYAGEFFTPPPWNFVYVILWAVVPLTVTGMFILGIIRAGNGKRDNGLGWLLIINALVAILPFSFGKTLLYDNDRLFMPVYPFIASLAGIGFGWLVTHIRKYAEATKHLSLAAPASLILGLALLTPQTLTAARLYPHLLSYYSEGVGGLPGATRMGLETTYWCETYAAALPYINAHANPGDVIWTQAWSFDVLKYYQKINRLRSDVVVLKVGMGPFNFYEADWYILDYRQTQYGKGGEKLYLPLKVLSTQIPVYGVNYQGIPLMRLYGRLK
jgi:4-amino-4-deoxy-L-arabinose transferase-like glycosyltransferase